MCIQYSSEQSRESNLCWLNTPFARFYFKDRDYRNKNRKPKKKADKNLNNKSKLIS